MIVVTGGAGFIGSNLVHALAAEGREDVVVVDDLTHGDKVRNFCGVALADYFDKRDFIERVRAGRFPLREADVVFHLGARARTTERDGRFMMENNYRYAVDLLHACAAFGVPFIYASSAAVYGGSRAFREEPSCEAPLSVYAYSKLLLDQLVRRRLVRGDFNVQVAGLRFFNVYGPREHHKGDMASIVLQLHRQLQDGDVMRLFEGCGGYDDGEQRRDFVHVDDVVAPLRWFSAHPEVSGVFNVGTGRSTSFNAVARAVARHFGRGRVDYVPLPASLSDNYQSNTQADLAQLRSVGCDVAFREVAEGVPAYLEWLDTRERRRSE